MFTEKKFMIPALTGISQKNIDEHLKLYAGYVKHVNLIQEKIAELQKTEGDPSETIRAGNSYLISELKRRFGFEFCGMRNHEYFFTQFEGGTVACKTQSALYTQLCETWGNFENWKKEFEALALTRGIGWAMLYRDTETNRLLHAWVDEQHLGQLATCDIILALDMWEHAYVYDYATSEKKNYIGVFFENLNWSVVESRVK